MFGKKAGRPDEKDRPGLLEKYTAQGYQTYTDIVPKETGCKDWNEYLIYAKTHVEKTFKRVCKPEDTGVQYRNKRKCR